MHNPSVVPGWLTLLGFGAVYLWVWWRQVKTKSTWTAYNTVTLFAFTWAVFLLWSKGWSPQWQQVLVPLMLLVQPDPRGVLLALLLAAVSFLEWPVLLSRGWAWGYWLTIPLRTLLIVGWGLGVGQKLWATDDAPSGRPTSGRPISERPTSGRQPAQPEGGVNQ